MSLPSYGDISDSKASVETVKSLSVQEAPKPTRSIGGGSGDRKSGMAGSYSSGGGEKAAKKKEAAEAKAKAREAFEKEKMSGKGVEIVDMSIPSYDQSTAQSQRGSFSL